MTAARASGQRKRAQRLPDGRRTIRPTLLGDEAERMWEMGFVCIEACHVQVGDMIAMRATWFGMPCGDLRTGRVTAVEHVESEGWVRIETATDEAQEDECLPVWIRPENIHAKC